MEQIEDEEDIDSVEISPVDLSFITLKEIGVEWLVEMSKYIRNNLMYIAMVSFELALPKLRMRSLKIQMIPKMMMFQVTLKPVK